MSEAYEKYYSDRLQDGEEFQDFAAAKLLSYGINITSYKTRENQNKHGESLQGIELKLDKNFPNTGNLYIEFAEKSNPSKPYFSASGILRNDNTFMIVIGNYKRLYVFSKKQLKRMHEWNKSSGKYRVVKTATSKAFLLPLLDAEKHCIMSLNFEPIKN